ncbi:MAG: hypothetical protein US42_C0017G0012 [Candidatus Magasanikbacteria bacterium GW2011_GWC2_37_14]|uniref:Uncharacterized protein n=1 Tax=Candidatus Magasanikbacteria bacterium GW2011_GWC2_37_14 TaxID=1619046 RepID=A0A0G0JFR2_9BACT|nr:MAG: hypothetical protein US42_C0017G0012 [Candidatus Magasanikbacteria bacterium GW2011_GWC2_37_14]
MYSGDRNRGVADAPLLGYRPETAKGEVLLAVEAEALPEVGRIDRRRDEPLIVFHRGDTEFTRAVNEKLELHTSSAEVGREHCSPLGITTNVAVVVESRPRPNVEVEPHEHRERPSVARLHEHVVHVRFATTLVRPGAKEQRPSNEVLHEAKLLQHLLSQEDGQHPAQHRDDDQSDGHKIPLKG